MTATEHAIELTRAAARAADERQATDQIGLDVSETLPYADVFLIASGRNERMVLSIAEEIEDKLREGYDLKALRREGTDLGRWVLLDFGDLVVHVFHEEEREYYSLERLWRDAPVVPLELATEAQD
ncbi:ribosome silencing factor [Gulosibacter faecalis]|jgi:ribosome-associated protein|uniref:Ribosomal silencing factor RsfS n=1 Tax=Gulosibacter faecalis TaxID=272240 RepID=A0ABW5UXB5_9MICO|nr:ribosome silencing factor [Gulosibacter faecalis]